MPRVEPTLLSTVVYLYESKNDAENTVTNYGSSGGTGFMVGVESKQYPGHSDLYFVTCKHIAKPSTPGKLPAPVVRVNTVDGAYEIIELSPSDWISYEEIYPGKRHDIAIYEWGEPESVYKYAFPLRNQILSRQHVRNGVVGVGDDILLVGRYVDHDGIRRNMPSVRFGNISLIPDDPLPNSEGFEEPENFIAELRSLSGYSGAPVFYYVPTYPPNNVEPPIIDRVMLLGMLWSEPPQYQVVSDVDRYMFVYSGMSNILPAWLIDDMLDWDAFKAHREEADKRRASNVR